MRPCNAYEASYGSLDLKGLTRPHKAYKAFRPVRLTRPYKACMALQSLVSLLETNLTSEFGVPGGFKATHELLPYSERTLTGSGHKHCVCYRACISNSTAIIFRGLRKVFNKPVQGMLKCLLHAFKRPINPLKCLLMLF